MKPELAACGTARIVFEPYRYRPIQPPIEPLEVRATTLGLGVRNYIYDNNPPDEDTVVIRHLDLYDAFSRSQERLSRLHAHLWHMLWLSDVVG